MGLQLIRTHLKISYTDIWGNLVKKEERKESPLNIDLARKLTNDKAVVSALE